jgi:hypothetical protein
VQLTRVHVCDAYRRALAEANPCLYVADALVSDLTASLVNPDPLNDYANETTSDYCCSISMKRLDDFYASLRPASNRWWAGAMLADSLQIAGLTALVTMLNIIMGQVWFLLAGCQCCQRSRYRVSWERSGNFVLLMSGVLPATYILWLVHFFMGDLPHAFFSFLEVKLLSATGSTIFQTLIFNCLWRRDMRPGSTSRYYVSYHDVRSFEEGSHTGFASHAATVASWWDGLLVACGTLRRPPRPDHLQRPAPLGIGTADLL